MKMILKYIKPYSSFMLVTLLIKTVGTLIELFIPYILSHIVDDIVPKQILSEIFFWGFMMLLCAAVGFFCNVVANRMASDSARKVTKNVRHDLFSASMYLTSKSADKLTIPSLESRITSDTYNLHHLVGMMQRIGVRAPLLLIGGIAITLIIDAHLALIMIALLPFITAIVVFISKKSIPMYKDVQSRVDGIVRVVREDAQGIRVIKALSKKDYEKRRFDKANKSLVKIEKKVGYIMGLSNPIMHMLLNLGLVGVVILGAYRVNEGLSGAGKIIAFLQYFTLISNAMMTITRIFTMYSKGVASANRIEEVLNQVNELQIESKEKYPPAYDGSHISFKDVSFAYNEGKPVLSGISFSLKRGQTLGVIGATGSGKSTIMSLLMRFYDVTEGSIKIDGVDVRTINQDELHSKFGVAFQNDFLYAGTIRENIDFGRNLDFSQIEEGARRAQALEFILDKENGFDYEITSKGTNISGGQKQRLLVARALAGSPEILILDDSSSALDYKTDLNLRRAIAETDGDTTVIIVAQRISSVMNSDLIIVLDEGEINGMGTHDELMESCQIYREISESQMGGAFLE